VLVKPGRGDRQKPARLTLEEVEERTTSAADGKAVAEVLEDAAGAWGPMVLYF